MAEKVSKIDLERLRDNVRLVLESLINSDPRVAHREQVLPVPIIAVIGVQSCIKNLNNDLTATMDLFSEIKVPQMKKRLATKCC